MNTMKLWKGTNNIAWLIEALLSSFFFLLFCCSPPFSLTHFSLPITLTFLSPFLPFLVGPVSFRSPSLLALPRYYLMPSPPSTLTFLSPFLPFLVGPVSSPFSFPLSPYPRLPYALSTSFPPPTYFQFFSSSKPYCSLLISILPSSPSFLFSTFHFPLPSPFALRVLPVLCTAQSYCPPPGPPIPFLIEKEVFLGIFKIISQELGQTIL